MFVLPNAFMRGKVHGVWNSKGVGATVRAVVGEGKGMVVRVWGWVLLHVALRFRLEAVQRQRGSDKCIGTS